MALCGCAQANVAASPLAAAAAPARNGHLPAFAAKRNASQPVQAEEPQAPLTDQEASAQCWMKYEKGRGDLSLDKRADLVDKCIDAKMHGRPVR